MIFKLTSDLYIGNHIGDYCRLNINNFNIRSILCISDIENYHHDFIIDNSYFTEISKNIILFSNIQLNNVKNYVGDYIACYNLLDSFLRYRSPVLLYCHDEKFELPIIISSMILYKKLSLIGIVSIQETIQHIKNLCYNEKMDVNEKLVKNVEIAMNIIYPFYENIKKTGCKDC